MEYTKDKFKNVGKTEKSNRRRDRLQKNILHNKISDIIYFLRDWHHKNRKKI